jgi:hypothetical protein
MRDLTSNQEISLAAVTFVVAVGIATVLGVKTALNDMPPVVVAAIISASAALILSSIGWKAARLQRVESLFRSVPSLTVDVVPSFLATSREEEMILQTKVIVKNISRVSCTIPAVYIRYHCLGAPLAGRHVGRINEDQLPEWGSMGRVVNAAWVHRAVVELGPDEIEEFVRWDTVDEVSIAQAQTSVAVAVVDVFATTTRDIGGGIVPRSRPGPRRHSWIQFMAQDDCVRNNEVIFSRYDPDFHGEHPKLEIYQRVIVHPRSGRRQIDLENTRTFKRILRNMLRWTRYQPLEVPPRGRLQRSARSGGRNRARPDGSPDGS